MDSQEDGYSLLRQTLLRIAPLPASELEYLQRHAEPRSYPTGRALIEAGETPTRCWFLIAGFLRPRSGTVTMDGRPITRPGADRGVVFQEYALLPWKNVRDNVALGLKFRGVPRAERERTADEFLKLTNLADAGDKFPFELSGGMKQRVALARTLANRPEVMLMDEPFAAVDAQTRMTLQEELLRLWNHSRVTVLFVTHSVDEAVFLADRVVVLTSGPGRVRASVAIDIPREDRTWNRLRQDERFSALCSDILALVRSPGASA